MDPHGPATARRRRAALTCTGTTPIVPAVQHRLVQSLTIIVCLTAHVAAGTGAFVLCDGFDGHFALETTHPSSEDHHDDHRHPCSDTSYDLVVIANRRSDVVTVDLDIAPLAILAPATVATIESIATPPRVSDPSQRRDSLAHLQTVVLLI